jgi:hypothetical protein
MLLRLLPLLLGTLRQLLSTLLLRLGFLFALLLSGVILLFTLLPVLLRISRSGDSD